MGPETVNHSGASNGFIAIFPTASSASASGSESLFGWVAGGGGETKINGNWLFRVEYLHYDFGRSATAAAGNFTAGFPTVSTSGLLGGNRTVDVVRAGVSLKFGSGA